MKTYTEKELLLAIDYACLAQKAECYQVAGNLLIDDFKTKDDVEKASIKVLDYLCNSKVISGQIKIEDVEEYFEPEGDYEGFCEHIKEYNDKGISFGKQDLLRLAAKYKCELPNLLQIEKPMSYELPNYIVGFDPYDNGSSLEGKMYITKKNDK